MGSATWRRCGRWSFAAVVVGATVTLGASCSSDGANVQSSGASTSQTTTTAPPTSLTTTISVAPAVGAQPTTTSSTTTVVVPPTAPPSSPAPATDLCTAFETTANPDDDPELATLLDTIGDTAAVWGLADGTFLIDLSGREYFHYGAGGLETITRSEFTSISGPVAFYNGYAEVAYRPAVGRLDCTFVDLTGD